MTVDLTLYLVLDPTIMRRNGVDTILEQAIRGGVSVVQLREKDCSDEEFLSLAVRVKPILDAYSIPFIINDRIDLVTKLNADGVHLGQSDFNIAEARRILGDSAIIGLSVENHAQALLAEREMVDYLGVSSIFSTPSKKDLKTTWGLQGLKELKKYSRHRLVGIGGIDEKNVQEVFEAGADGVAVIAAIGSAANPLKNTKRLRAVADQILTRRTDQKC